jgi:hypothetical protein
MKLKILLFFLFFSISGYAQVKSDTDLDSIAQNIPEEFNQSTKSIANYFRSISNDERELSRLIFSWVAYHIKYDDESFNNLTFKSPDPDSVLKYGVAVCAGYSKLFKAICNDAALEAISIDGFAKGYGFKNGMPVNGVNHSWNAVKFNQAWHLIDVTWGSGFAENVNGKAQSKSVFTDYWFDVPAQEFIFNHFPDSSKYQYLSKKISREQFKKMIYLEANSVFKMGFNSDTIFNKSLSNMGFELPSVYNPKSIDFKFINVPHKLNLNSNSSYVFELLKDSISTSEFVLLNNQSLIKFDELGDNKLKKVVEGLEKGSLHFGINRGMEVEIIVSYVVK